MNLNRPRRAGATGINGFLQKKRPFMNIDRTDPGSFTMRLQTGDEYILSVELANEKYIPKDGPRDLV